MALRTILAKKRLFSKTRNVSPVPLQTSPDHARVSGDETAVPPSAAKTNFHRKFLTSPDTEYSEEKGLFRRFLQRRRFNQQARLPEFLSVPVGDKLREKLRLMNLSGDRLQLEGLSPPVPENTTEYCFDGISVMEARKILRTAQLEKLRSRLRNIPANSIAYSEFVQICIDACSNRDQGLEFAKTLDECGNVIVLGNFVFLRPDQVTRSMEQILLQNVAIPNDPRKKELEQMEKQKVAIDRKAELLVKGELYGGLGLLVLQTLGFMRLTFWELSWDVMEPICFFVTSLHFALAYGFFLRTSKEPSFEGYFQRRFKVKQKKLMKTHNFDVDKYNKLCEAFYPTYYNPEKSDYFKI